MQERITIVVNLSLSFHPSSHRSKDFFVSINPVTTKNDLKISKCYLLIGAYVHYTDSVNLHFVSRHTLFTTFTQLQVYSGYSSTA